MEATSFYYSVLRHFTGFTFAALIAWQATVIHAMTNAMTNALTNAITPAIIKDQLLCDHFHQWTSVDNHSALYLHLNSTKILIRIFQRSYRIRSQVSFQKEMFHPGLSCCIYNFLNVKNA